MINRAFYLLIWVTFIVYAFVFAPENQPDTFTLIKDLSTGQWSDINPWIISLFNAMGLWPIIYTALLLRDGQKQSFPAWPFAIASFFVGAFAILPYLVFRQSPSENSFDLTEIKRWESKVLPIMISIGFLIFFSFGLSQGNWGNFAQQWFSDRFIHVMSLDFCLLSLLIPSLTIDDRQGRDGSIPLWIDFIPVIGGLIYLYLRSPISLSSQEEQA